MAKKIGKKIVKVAVKKEDSVVSVALNENTKRPEILRGTTYKLKTPLSDSAIYITINDIVLNDGTDNEIKQPYEIFINSKEMKSFSFVVAITRLISSVFRKGGDITFIVEELKSVFDPNGGYLAKGGRYVPSLVAEIGMIIEKHFISIGLINKELHSEVQAIVDKKKAEFEASGKSVTDNASVCHKCHEKAVVIQEGCSMCLSCGDSRCH